MNSKYETKHNEKTKISKNSNLQKDNNEKITTQTKEKNKKTITITNYHNYKSYQYNHMAQRK